MFNEFLAKIARRNYNYIDVVVIAMFTALVCSGRWWEGFFAIMLGAVISSSLEFLASRIATQSH